MGTSTWGFSPRLRDEQIRKDFDKAPETTTSAMALADHYAEQEKRRIVEAEAREQERYREAAEYVAQKKIEEKRRLQERVLSIMFDSNAATPKEITRVTQMIQATCPNDYGKVETHWMKLMELRSLIGEEK